MRFDDLMALHLGANADEAFPYIPSEDRERMQTGRCPEHIDSTPVIVPPSQAPPPWWQKDHESGRNGSVSGAYATRSATSDLVAQHIRCSWEGCDERSVDKWVWASSAGMQVSMLCTSHAEDARHRELDARASEGRVRRRDRSNLTPMTGWVELPRPDLVWSEDDWHVIRNGYNPRYMEEKWFWFVEGMVLCAHRSWTGHEVYRARFERDGDDYRIADLRAATGIDLRWLHESISDPQLGTRRFVDLVNRELLRL